MRILLTTMALLTLAGTAAAKAPSLTELPTVKRVFEFAEKKRVDLRTAEARANQDDKLDAIRAYGKGNFKRTAFADVLKYLLDTKEEKKYRVAAYLAIRERFNDLAGYDTVKKAIALPLLTKLRSKDKDERTWAGEILATFWPGNARKINYDPNQHNYRTLNDKYKEWKKVVDRK